MTVRCACGRFLARARAERSYRSAGYASGYYLSDVRGDCSRCGPGAQAGRADDAWWWDWDAWTWDEGIA